MELKYFIILACVCVASGRKWRPKLPPITTPPDEVILRPNEHLQTFEGYEPTAKYLFLDEFYRDTHDVRVFGVRTKGQARITLHDSSGDLADLRLSVGGNCSVEYLLAKKPTNISFPCEKEMEGVDMTWFTLESTMNYVALYAQGVVEPIIELSNEDLNNHSINLLSFDKYSLSSQEDALWDVQGHLLDDEDLINKEMDPLLNHGLKRVKETHLEMIKQKWRCDYARANIKAEAEAEITVSSRRRMMKFIHKYCHLFQPYIESIGRHEAIMQVNSIEIPKASSYDVAEFFSKTYKR